MTSIHGSLRGCLPPAPAERDEERAERPVAPHGGDARGAEVEDEAALALVCALGHRAPVEMITSSSQRPAGSRCPRSDVRATGWPIVNTLLERVLGGGRRRVPEDQAVVAARASGMACAASERSWATMSGTGAVGLSRRREGGGLAWDGCGVPTAAQVRLCRDWL